MNELNEQCSVLQYSELRWAVSEQFKHSMSPANSPYY